MPGAGHGLGQISSTGGRGWQGSGAGNGFGTTDFNSAPPRQPPSGLMKDFKFSTERFCQNTAGLLRKGQGTALSFRRQTEASARGSGAGMGGPPARHTGPRAAGSAHGPSVWVQGLCEAETAMSSREAKVLVRFKKLTLLSLEP